MCEGDETVAMLVPKASAVKSVRIRIPPLAPNNTGWRSD